MNEQQVEEALKGLQAQLHAQQKFVTATLVEDVKRLKEQVSAPKFLKVGADEYLTVVLERGNDITATELATGCVAIQVKDFDKVLFITSPTKPALEASRATETKGEG